MNAAEKDNNHADEQSRLHAEALAEGFKDETCTQCGTEFLAHIHFIRCHEGNCPMKSPGSKSFLQMWADEIDARASAVSTQP